MKTKLFALLIAVLLGYLPQMSSAVIISDWEITVDVTAGSSLNVDVGVFPDGVFNNGQTLVIEIVKIFGPLEFDKFGIGQKPLILSFKKLSSEAPSEIVIANAKFGIHLQRKLVNRLNKIGHTIIGCVCVNSCFLCPNGLGGKKFLINNSPSK